MRETGRDYVRPGGPWESGGHLGVESQAGGGTQSLRAGGEEAGEEDVEPVDQRLLPRSHQGLQGPGTRLAVAGHAVESLERAAHQGQVPGEDAALGVNQSAGGKVLTGVQQLVGRLQAGTEQLETAEEDCDQVGSGERGDHYSNS